MCSAVAKTMFVPDKVCVCVCSVVLDNMIFRKCDCAVCVLCVSVQCDPSALCRCWSTDDLLECK